MSRLGELLLRDQIISPEQLHRAQEESKKSGERLGNTLIKVGAIQEDDLTQFLSKQYGVPAINLSEFEIDRDVITLLPKEVVERRFDSVAQAILALKKGDIQVIDRVNPWSLASLRSDRKSVRRWLPASTSRKPPTPAATPGSSRRVLPTG